ncbi:hypothetical protein [Candidatus Erwinia haradaeae]|uniref:hypothetical protein n=1 Tax=Candidatus Erwinia haradaeae TaxID=1922217 RepID=UPI00130017B9|nr:hypothetical protein [Candidatus Erwinia haradaeae]
MIRHSSSNPFLEFIVMECNQVFKLEKKQAQPPRARYHTTIVEHYNIISSTKVCYKLHSH